jgi:hypothetical protein
VRISVLEKKTSLFVLNAPEGQVDAWLSDARFFWNLMLEIFLSIASHD